MAYFLDGPTCGFSPASGRGTKNLLSTTTGEQDQELVQKSAVFVRNTLCTIYMRDEEPPNAKNW